MTRIGPMTLMFVCAVALVGCSDEKDKSESAQDDGSLTPVIADTISGESQKTEVDATSKVEFVGFDLDSGTFIAAADLPTNTTWDLAFKRTTVKMNPDVRMLISTEADYSKLEKAPADGYVADQASTDPAAPETTGLAFHQGDPWYAYDINTHVVSSRSLVYVVASNDGRHFKLKFNDYYNVERLPAFINFEYQEVAGADQ